MRAEKKTEKKLMAVIGCSGIGVFLRAHPQSTGSYYIGSDGAISYDMENLEDLLKDSSRRPVYEGESIELKF